MKYFRQQFVQFLNLALAHPWEADFRHKLLAFFENTFSGAGYTVAANPQINLVTFTDQAATSQAAILFRIMSPANPNATTLQQILRDYLHERPNYQNINLRLLVITNIYEWYILDNSDLEGLWEQTEQTIRNDKERLSDPAVNDIPASIGTGKNEYLLKQLPENLPFICFDFKTGTASQPTSVSPDDPQLTRLCQILHPQNLLKLPVNPTSISTDETEVSSPVCYANQKTFREGFD
jgi:adenine-specific DNA-methyltransferase